MPKIAGLVSAVSSYKPFEIHNSENLTQLCTHRIEYDDPLKKATFSSGRQETVAVMKIIAIVMDIQTRFIQYQSVQPLSVKKFHGTRSSVSVQLRLLIHRALVKTKKF